LRVPKKEKRNTGVNSASHLGKRKKDPTSTWGGGKWGTQGAGNGQPAPY